MCVRTHTFTLKHVTCHGQPIDARVVFLHGVVEVFALLECYATYFVRSVPYSRVKQSKKTKCLKHHRCITLFLIKPAVCEVACGDVRRCWGRSALCTRRGTLILFALVDRKLLIFGTEGTWLGLALVTDRFG
jgi:hypothetical protein